MATNPVTTRNEILNALSEADREWIFSRSTFEDAPVKRVFVEPGKALTHVYFVEEGLVSMLLSMKDSSAVEVGTTGTEGLVGLQVFLGGEPGQLEIFQQVPGEVIVLPAKDFEHLLGRSQQLQQAMFGFALSLMRQMTMAVACNRLHPVEQRLARWLLMVRDRVQSEEFPLTQLFIAQMLGVQRPGVSKAAATLKRAGMISYTRGRIRIFDAKRLEAVACECYGALRRDKKHR